MPGKASGNPAPSAAPEGPVSCPTLRRARPRPPLRARASPSARSGRQTQPERCGTSASHLPRRGPVARVPPRPRPSPISEWIPRRDGFGHVDRLDREQHRARFQHYQRAAFAHHRADHPGQRLERTHSARRPKAAEAHARRPRVRGAAWSRARRRRSRGRGIRPGAASCAASVSVASSAESCVTSRSLSAATRRVLSASAATARLPRRFAKQRFLIDGQDARRHRIPGATRVLRQRGSRRILRDGACRQQRQQHAKPQDAGRHHQNLVDKVRSNRCTSS